MISYQHSIPGMGNTIASMLRPNGILPSLTFVLLLSIGTAWSYDGHYTSYNDTDVSRETLQNNNKGPSSVLTEQCLSLLNTHKTRNISVKSRSQRAVGQVAALGIILGARFALELKNDNADLLTKKVENTMLNQGNSKRTAHAIANYRQCLKQTALNRTAKKNDV